MKVVSPRVLAALVVSSGVFAAPMAVDAHHSFAMYDQTKLTTFTGKVVRLVPSSNHAVIIFELFGDDQKPMLADGKPVTWQAEGPPASALANHGVTVKTLPAGTVITVSLYPLRDGRSAGAMTGPIVICGPSLPTGGCNEKTGQVFNVKNQ